NTLALLVAGHATTGNSALALHDALPISTSGAVVTASATVADSAPSATVSLNTSAPKTNDVLTATATRSDVDGDSVTLTYVWKVRGEVQTSAVQCSCKIVCLLLLEEGHGS